MVTRKSGRMAALRFFCKPGKAGSIMREKPPLKSMLKSVPLFVALFAVTFFMLLRGRGLHELRMTLRFVKPAFLALGALCVFFYIASEALNTRFLLRLFGYRPRLASCLKYSFCGYFFCAITPSSSGGQPMQVYYMKKDGVEIFHSSLALLVELAVYQLVAIVLAVLSFLGSLRFFSHIPRGMLAVVSVGLLLNAAVLVFTYFAIFSHKTAAAIVQFGLRILAALHVKQVDALQERAEAQLEQYRDSAALIRSHPREIVRIALITIVQIVSLHSISFFVYRALGLNQFGYLSLLMLQSVLHITVSAIPLPGAIGASESGFHLIYRTVYPRRLLGPATVLARGIGFYLYVAVSACVVLATHLSLARRAGRDSAL